MAFNGTGILHDFDRALLHGEHDFSSDTFKIALYTASANLSVESTTNYVAGSAAEIPASNGYTSGGSELNIRLERDSIGYHVNADDVRWTNIPNGTAIRGALIYNDTRSDKAAVSVHDFGRDYIVNDGTFLAEISTAELGVPLIRLATN